ncbi:MAG: helix-turn-helix transcriptional regulator [Oscillospiraceae bacterium]|nr:helix-turn-helix transcriptional regulator [Oscillospiraceae bacterium]
MTPEERGRRIKEARIAKKMTQSEVVGSFITRNMLSQIESGSAVPSLKTLEYLASVLDIPISSLMPQGEDAAAPEAYPETERLVKIKGLFSDGLYCEAITEAGRESDWGSLKDEFTAVLAQCYFKLAEVSAADNTVKAVEYAKEAAALAEKGFYANDALKGKAINLLNSLAEQLSRYYAGLISDI